MINKLRTTKLFSLKFSNVLGYFNSTFGFANLFQLQNDN